jgi:O-antigen/teichoic acid export membrane protein
MLSILFAQPGHLFAQFLVARGRHGRLAVARLAIVLVNLGLSIVLALWVGLWGVAAATLITETISTAIVIPFLLRRESGVSLRAVVAAWLRPVVLGGLAALPTLLALGWLLDVDTLAEFVGVGLVWLAVYGVLVWWFVMGETERRTIRDAFGRRPTAAVADTAQPLP